MDDKKYDVVVIGGGPSAWAVLSAIPEGPTILNIDIGKEESPKTLNLINEARSLIQDPINAKGIDEFIKKLIGAEATKLGTKKSSYGDHFMYDLDGTNVLNHSTLTKSIAAGGFANVWGGTMLPYPEPYLKGLNYHVYRKFQHGYEFIVRNIPICKFDQKNNLYKFPNTIEPLNEGTVLQRKLLRDLPLYSRLYLQYTNAVIEPIGIAVQLRPKSEQAANPVPCANCGLCQIGCPNRLIWNPRYHPIEDKVNNVIRHRAEVKRIVACEKGFKIYCDTEQAPFISESVILAAGALGTAEILTKSTFSKDFSSLKVHDNQTVFRHAFSFSKIGNLKPRINLAELTYTVGATGHDPINAQLYSISTYTKERIISQIPLLSKFPDFLFNACIKRLVTLLVYFPQHQSGELIVKKEQNSVTIKTRDYKMSRIQEAANYFRLAIPLLIHGIFLLPFYKHRLEVGGGNHIGSTEFLDDENRFIPICSSDGFLSGETDFLIADSSALGNLYPGPITMSVMALAYSNTQDYFKTKYCDQ